MNKLMVPADFPGVQLGGRGKHVVTCHDQPGPIVQTARAQLCIVPSVCDEACSTTVRVALASHLLDFYAE